MGSFRTALDFGTFSLPWHALILVLAVAVGVLVTGRIVKQRGMYRDLALDICILCIPVGLLGGRVFAALSGKIAWSTFLSFGEPGLNLCGALLFCFAGVWVYCRIKRFAFGQTLDILMPGMLLAIAVGRWQDFFLCEGLGYPVENSALKFFPLATFTEAYFTDGRTVAYAIFFLEFVVMAALGVFVWRVLLRRDLQDGDTAALTLLLYGCAAGIMESLRDEAYRQVVFADVTFNNFVYVLIAVAALLFLLIGKRFPAIRAGMRRPRPAPQLDKASDDAVEKPSEPTASEPEESAESTTSEPDKLESPAGENRKNP